MNKFILLKALFAFILLIMLEISLSFLLTKLFYYEDIVFLSVDLSHLIVILILFKTWKIDLKKFFIRISFKKTLFIITIGLLIVLLYPIFNIPSFFKNIIRSQTPLMEINLSFFNYESLNFSKVYFLLRTLIIMPFFEEILYRGFILKKLSEKYHYIFAIVISSLLFSLGHMNLEQSIVTFFSGLIIGTIFYKCKNLTSVILLHIVINLFTLFFKPEFYENYDVKIYIYHLALIIITFVLSLIMLKACKNE